jgi:prepilin-type processing-associated H-X9-DG protein
LLVVTGIIGVLMGILFPALSRVRQQAAAVQCSTNLRALAAGWIMYADANRHVSCPGRLPTWGSPAGVYYIGDSSEYRPRWYELLGAMNGYYACKNPRNIEDDSWTIENRMFLCPSVPEWDNSRNYPYGYNYQFLGNARPRGNGSWINWPVMAVKISGGTVMAMDCMGTAAGKPKDQRMGHYNDGTKDAAAMGNKGWAVDPPRLLPTSDYADPQHRSPADRSGPDPRHSGRSNVAFCDGHVELMTPGDMGYSVNADGSIAASGADATNRLFSGTGHDDDPPSVH